MQLLDEIKPSQLSDIGHDLTQFCNIVGSRESKIMSDWLAAMQELAQQLCIVSETTSNSIRAHIGRHLKFSEHPLLLRLYHEVLTL